MTERDHAMATYIVRLWSTSTPEQRRLLKELFQAFFPSEDFEGYRIKALYPEFARHQSEQAK